jgi:2'-5' RNA ligase
MSRKGGGANDVESIRAFIALELDPMSLRRVVRLADRLRMASGAPSAAWMPHGKLHLTMKFMAELPADAVTPLGKVLGALVEGKRAPTPGTCSLQAFPAVHQASVVVIEFEDPARTLAKLAARIDKLTVKYGVPRESRAFRPHVTLARLKRPYDSQRWLRPELADAAGDFVASRLTLYRSDLGADKDGGSTYVPLARFDYAAEEAAPSPHITRTHKS